MRRVFVLLLLLASVAASAQQDHLKYPDHFNICDESSQCIVVTRQGDGWVGTVETKPEWIFTIDDFRIEHVKFTGISTAKASDGHSQTLVVEGKPEMTVAGNMHSKAKYTVGGKTWKREVTVTWPSTFKIPNGARI